MAREDFVGNKDLAVGRQFQSQLDRCLDLRIHAVLRHRTMAGDFLQGGFAALIVQFLKR